MATLTYVFDEGNTPSPKDTIISEEAAERGLIVSEVPDVYPGLAGELEITGGPQALIDLLGQASAANAPGHPTKLHQFTSDESDAVEAHFKTLTIALNLVS